MTTTSPRSGAANHPDGRAGAGRAGSEFPGAVRRPYPNSTG
ncbi:hypothetical protein ACQPYA_22480 [Micromonospora sp. CA-263727]